MDAGTVVVVLKNDTDVMLSVNAGYCKHEGDWVTSPPDTIDPHTGREWATKPINLMLAPVSQGTQYYSIGMSRDAPWVEVNWFYDTRTGEKNQWCRVPDWAPYKCTPPDPSSYAGANPTMVFTLSSK